MKEKFLEPLFKENPVLVLTIGMCPTLAVTTNVENALVMGLSVIAILFLTSILVTILRPLITDTVRIPAYIVVIATLVTILELLMSRFMPDIYGILGIYVPLIVVNCIILSSALEYAKEKNLFKNIFSSLGTGLGFTIALAILALVRELLGSNSITIVDSLSELVGFKLKLVDVFSTSYMPISLFRTPAGAFFALGLIIAFVQFIKNKRGDKNATS
jgi:electron transport complex protein RnfE